MIFKILRADEWAAFQRDGRFSGAPVDLADGYIHFSTAEQVAETARKHFGRERNLTLVAVDDSGLGDSLKWEVSRNDALFPHLYAVLEMSQVVWAEPFPLGDDDRHILPEALK